MPFGAYLHVPFCRHRCDYCAFATWTDRHHLAERYLDACRTQIERDVAAGVPDVPSAFVGGGTPTQVAPALLLRALAALPLAAGAEVTVECNPDDLTAEIADAYAAGEGGAAVDRRAVDGPRGAGGRSDHDPGNVRRAVEAARSAGSSPSTSTSCTARPARRSSSGNLGAAIGRNPNHVSAYALTVEEAGTPLAADAVRHPDDDVQADEYHLATERLGAAGVR
ncbi:MAG: radical SAM protein [Acidimicrobiales bacterium]